MDKTVIEKRNKRLLEFFQNKNIEVKIIGDINKPAVIYEKMHACLSCYVHNFELIFLDKPDGGNELFRVKLTELIDQQCNKKVVDWFYGSTHKELYILKIQTNLFNLFLTGFHKTINDEYIPVFCGVNPKYYFTREKAEEAAKKHSTENVKLIVI
jgi:hypothetical protein